jgi:hypothetical protein
MESRLNWRKRPGEFEVGEDEADEHQHQLDFKQFPVADAAERQFGGDADQLVGSAQRRDQAGDDVNGGVGVEGNAGHQVADQGRIGNANLALQHAPRPVQPVSLGGPIRPLSPQRLCSENQA